MSNFTLTCALTDNPRTRPLLNGTVAPKGIDLTITALHASEMFWRQLTFAEFDISEMSVSSLTIATSKGPTPWVALPIFTSRKYFHSTVLIRTDRGINAPIDLNGKLVGVPEFQQTAVIWTRAVLRSEFGVDHRTMRWLMERNPDQSHGGAMGFTPPAGIDLGYVPKNKNLGQLLIDGEVDALLHWIDARNLIDRSNDDPRSNPHVRYLFPDPVAEGKRYYRKTGIFPINHCLVVRRSIAEQFPWVIESLYDAFVAAKARLARDLDSALEPYIATGHLEPDVSAGVTAEVLSYGIRACRPELETITRSVYEDGLAQRQVDLSELFAESMLGT